MGFSSLFLDPQCHKEGVCRKQPLKGLPLLLLQPVQGRDTVLFKVTDVPGSPTLMLCAH